MAAVKKSYRKRFLLPILLAASPAPAQSVRDGAIESILAPLKACEPDGQSALDGPDCFPLKVLLLIRSALKSSARERVDTARRVLEGLWRNDAALGLDPWKSQLKYDDFQSGIVELLAVEVRQGRSTVPLKALQEFALNEARRGIGGATDPHRLKWGLLLLGVTDAPNQVAFFRRVIENDTGGARSDAIGALQYRCDSGTQDLLRELTNWKVLSAIEQERVRVVIRLREFHNDALCQPRRPK